MTKPSIKIGFTDYFNPIDEFFIDLLSEDFEVIRDDANPNYLFFCDETFGKNNLNYDESKVTKIFYTGENRRPWNYRCHYAISFDHMEGHQFYRLPLYAIENWVNQKKLGWHDIRLYRREMRAKDKKGFCSFIVRNGGCAERNEIFHKLSEYKTVDSGGPLFNNIGGPIAQDQFNSHITKTNFIKERKFCISYENSSYPGYTTEKILHAFLGDSIPIYWGSPCVEMDFNKEAFVSRHDFRTVEEMIKYIIHLDSNDKAYDDIISQPLFKGYNKFLDFDLFRFWFRQNVYKG